MTIWKPPSVGEEPVTMLHDWDIVYAEFKKGQPSYHLRGLTEHDGGRVSSPIIEFDLASMIGRTRSGRHYILSNENGRLDEDVAYVWNAWVAQNNVTSYRVVKPQELSDAL